MLHGSVPRKLGQGAIFCRQSVHITATSSAMDVPAVRINVGRLLSSVLGI